eukprot:m.949215 g.949215  ORF g.949215 m.949215 type:complete len:51 (+) comp315477_c0_seq1:35-187(+)
MAFLFSLTTSLQISIPSYSQYDQTVTTIAGMTNLLNADLMYDDGVISECF